MCAFIRPYTLEINIEQQHELNLNFFRSCGIVILVLLFNKLIKQLIDKLPWWMNPKYPMGRSDYFWISCGLLLALFLFSAITGFCIAFIDGFIEAYRGATGGPEFDVPEWWFSAAGIPFLLISIPIEYRRCKAAEIPYQIIWINLGIGLVDLFGYPDDNFTVLSLVTCVLSLWIWLAPNRMEVIHEKPIS